LETVLRVVDKTGKFKYSSKDDYGHQYGFEPVCLIPFERKLMNLNLLSFEQVDWLNWYHGEVRQKLGAELLKQEKKK